MTQRRTKKNFPLDKQLQEEFKNLDDKERKKIAEFILAISERPLEIEDLWEQPEMALTNWLLVISGINQKEEMEIAKKLFFWKGIFSKGDTRVRCVQNSEQRAYKCCVKHFDNLDCPVLLMSDSPNMEN